MHHKKKGKKKKRSEHSSQPLFLISVIYYSDQIYRQIAAALQPPQLEFIRNLFHSLFTSVFSFISTALLSSSMTAAL